MSESRSFRGQMKAHVALGLPLVGSHLAQMAIGMTDTVMLGWYDVEALAGLVLATTLFIVLFLFGSGFAFAVTPLVAAAVEAEDDTRVRRVTRMGLWASGGFALAVMPLMWFSGPLLEAFGQDEALAHQAQVYLRIMGWGILPALVVMTLKSHLAALERTRVQLYVTLGAAVLNAGVNYLLIFGTWIAPELGIAGAAIASLSVNIMSALVLGVYATRSFPEHRLFERMWRPDWEAAFEVLRMGGQIGFTVLAEVGLFSATSLLMGLLGTVPLAAHGIALQIASVSFMVPLGVSNAATVRAGRAFGRRDGAGLRSGALAALTLGTGWALAAAVIFVAFPGVLLGIYLAPDEPLREAILAAGRPLLAMAALFQIADAVQVISVGALRGMQDTRVPMWAASASYWLIGAPASYGFGIVLGWGGVGVWLGLVLGLAAAAVILSVRFWQRSARLASAPAAALQPAAFH